jgi:hypothetical protein
VPVSEAIQRLLNLRALEEEQHKLALESALGELRRIENALHVTRMRERSGKEHLAAAAQSHDFTDRIAGLIECESAHRNAHILEIRLTEKDREAAELRLRYLYKRTERRQVETIIREAETVGAVEGVRRDQQRMDDWFSTRRHAAKTHRPVAEKPEMKSHKESGAVPEEELRSKL